MGNHGSKLPNSFHFSSRIEQGTSVDIFDSLLHHGVEHVTEHIIGYLDDPTVAKCRLVSKNWNSLLQKEWLVRKIYHFCKQNGIITKGLDYIVKVSSIETLEEIVKVLQTPEYSWGRWGEQLKHPLLIASSKGNVLSGPFSKSSIRFE